MGLGRYVVDAVLLEGQSPGALARRHGISRSWVYRLLARYREGGYPALEPRSRRPLSCSHQVDPETEATILRLRQGLIDAGLDAGAQTIAHHLTPLVSKVPSVAPPGTGHASASQAAQVLSAPFRGRAPQPDVASRHHPLVPGQWPRS